MQLVKLVNEMVMVYDGVYGLTSKDRSKASSFALGYKLEFIGLKTFQKAWSSRLPAGIGSVTSVTDPFSSWSHYSTGRHDVLQLDEQNARVWVDGAEKRGNVAPSHGLIVDKDDIQKGMKILGVKMPFGYHAKLTKIHWNGGQLRADAGARNIQVLYDNSKPLQYLLVFYSRYHHQNRLQIQKPPGWLPSYPQSSNSVPLHGLKRNAQEASDWEAGPVSHQVAQALHELWK